MYKSNYNFFFKNKGFAYILLLLIITFSLLLVGSNLLAQDINDSQNMDLMKVLPQVSMDLELDDEQLPESDITTKIYRSTDNLNEVFNETKSELDPTFDVDVINKEDLIGMPFDSKKKIIQRENLENGNTSKRNIDNIYLPWILFTVILILFIIVVRVIKQVKI